MAYEQLPVTPAIITWARKRTGLSIEDASKTFKHIEEWEEGESAPTYPQLEQLAEALKIPTAVFFFPEPPQVPQIGETFRTLADTDFEQIPSKVQLLLRRAKALQLNLIELTGEQNPARRLITRDITLSPDANLQEIAQTVRTYLGVSLDEQQSWPDDEAALKNWRDALLRGGIFVFKEAFRVDEYSGFCLYDDLFPIIFVNNSSAKTRQIFTLFHELAHLLFHTSGIDTVHDEYIPHLANGAQRIEILCNRFATEFLLPDDIFAASVRGQEPTEETAERLAARFKVSREVVFRRFLDRRWIDQQTYEQAARRWADQRQSAGPGGDYYWTKLAYLGRDYVALALTLYRQNRIDETQLADYLDTKPKNLPALEEYFARGA